MFWEARHEGKTQIELWGHGRTLPLRTRAFRVRWLANTHAHRIHTQTVTPVLPCQRRQRHDPSRSFPVDLRCQHGSTRFTHVWLPFPVLQGSPRWFLTCQKPPERPLVHPGPSGIIPVHHGGTTVQPPVLPGSPRSMDRGEPGSTGSPVGLMQ